MQPGKIKRLYGRDAQGILDETLIDMELTFKLLVTPILIGAASLAGRRWGPAVSGWLVGLPLTSGPILLFIALAQGTDFATTTAVGTLTGALAQIVLCTIYARLAGHHSWPVTILAAFGGFGLMTTLLQYLPFSAEIGGALVIVSLILALRTLPNQKLAQAAPPVTPPAWDLPLRMIVATSFVLALTGSATILGPRLTGLLAQFPIYGSILIVFAHHLYGVQAAFRVLRGFLFGLFAFTGFFLTLATLLVPAGIGAAFTIAIVVAFAIQAGTLRFWKNQEPRTEKPGTEEPGTDTRLQSDIQ